MSRPLHSFDPGRRSRLEGYSTLIVECTYLPATLDDVSLEEEAAKRGHVCWGGDKGLGKVFSSRCPGRKTTWVLIHFSLRHSDSYVTEFFTDEAACGFPFRPKGDPSEVADLVSWLDFGIIELCLS